LRLTGDQLTIELQVDRAEAYDRLSTDSETILKAVRALGIEVDKVTVQQPQAQGSVNARSDNSAAFSGGGRDANFSTSGDSGGRESGQAGARGGRDGQDEPGTHIAGGSLAHQNRDERGLYI
jgi:chemotaxis protein MotD